MLQKDIIVTKCIDNNDEINIRSTVSKDNISLSNDKIVKKDNEKDELFLITFYNYNHK